MANSEVALFKKLRVSMSALTFVGSMSLVKGDWHA